MVSYEMSVLVQWAGESFEEYIRPDLIVADEVHMIKNHHTRRTQDAGRRSSGARYRHPGGARAGSVARAMYRLMAGNCDSGTEKVT